MAQTRWCTTRNYNSWIRQTCGTAGVALCVYTCTFSQFNLILLYFSCIYFPFILCRINFIHKFITSIVTRKLNISHYLISLSTSQSAMMTLLYNNNRYPFRQHKHKTESAQIGTARSSWCSMNAQNHIPLNVYLFFLIIMESSLSRMCKLSNWTGHNGNGIHRIRTPTTTYSKRMFDGVMCCNRMRMLEKGVSNFCTHCTFTVPCLQSSSYVLLLLFLLVLIFLAIEGSFSEHNSTAKVLNAIFIVS